MKKLFKKLALAVVALLTFSVGSNYTVKEVKAADGDITFNINYSDGYTAGYGSSGTKGSLSKKDSTNTHTMNYSYSGINTQSSNGSVYSYSMYLKNYGYIYSTNEVDGYFPSSVTVTFSSGTGTSGKIITTYGSSSLTSRNTTGSVNPTKNGTYTIENEDPTKLYWNFSTTNANVQVTNIKVVYSLVPSSSELTAEKIGEYVLTTVSDNISNRDFYKKSSVELVTVENYEDTEVAISYSVSDNTGVFSVDDGIVSVEPSEDLIISSLTAHAWINGVEVYSKEVAVYTAMLPMNVTDAVEIASQKEHNTYTESKYFVIGKITEVYNTEYGNAYITDGTTSMTLYGMYDLEGVRYDALTTKPIAGDEIVIFGILGKYNTTNQMTNGTLYSINEFVSSSKVLENYETNSSLKFEYSETQTKTYNENTVNLAASDLLSWSGIDGVNALNKTTYVQMKNGASINSEIIKEKEVSYIDEIVLTIGSFGGNVAGKITVSLLSENNEEIKSVELDIAEFKDSDTKTKVTFNFDYYIVNETKISITSSVDADYSTSFRINNLSMVCKSSVFSYSYSNFSSFAVRFSTPLINKDIWDKLGEVVDFGFEIKTTGEFKKYSINSNSGELATDSNGNVSFAIVLNLGNLDYTQFNTKFYARAYVTVGTTTTYFVVNKYDEVDGISVAEMVEHYIENYDASTLSQYPVIESLSKYIESLKPVE